MRIFLNRRSGLSKGYRLSHLITQLSVFLLLSSTANAAVIAAGTDQLGSGLSGQIVDSITISSVDKFGDAVDVITRF